MPGGVGVHAYDARRHAGLDMFKYWSHELEASHRGIDVDVVRDPCRRIFFVGEMLIRSSEQQQLSRSVTAELSSALLLVPPFSDGAAMVQAVAVPISSKLIQACSNLDDYSAYFEVSFGSFNLNWKLTQAYFD